MRMLGCVSDSVTIKMAIALAHISTMNLFNLLTTDVILFGSPSVQHTRACLFKYFAILIPICQIQSYSYGCCRKSVPFCEPIQFCSMAGNKSTRAMCRRHSIDVY